LPLNGNEIMVDWTAALEATAIARSLRGSVWAYPLVNACHILGVALLVGAIVPLDIRLIGGWSSTPLAPLYRILTRMASVGLALAIASGLLLFITRTSDYFQSSLFLVKMALVLTGVINALLLNRIADHQFTGRSESNKLPWRIRFAACISLASWLTAMLLGRLVGYY
jgi:hypothetical protein